MKTSSVLKKAKALVQRGWHQNGLTGDKEGIVLYHSEQAKSWDILGALLLASLNSKRRNRIRTKSERLKYTSALSAMQSVTGEKIAQWNDFPGRTKEEVLAAIDDAISTRSVSEKH